MERDDGKEIKIIELENEKMFDDEEDSPSQYEVVLFEGDSQKRIGLYNSHRAADMVKAAIERIISDN